MSGLPPEFERYLKDIGDPTRMKEMKAMQGIKNAFDEALQTMFIRETQALIDLGSSALENDKIEKYWEENIVFATIASIEALQKRLGDTHFQSKTIARSLREVQKPKPKEGRLGDNDAANC